MPGALARTSTFALTNATYPYALKIANEGYKKALTNDPALKNGLNVCLGAITHPAVATALDKEFVQPDSFL
jgi:alanine dehydrogenase